MQQCLFVSVTQGRHFGFIFVKEHDRYCGLEFYKLKFLGKLVD